MELRIERNLEMKKGMMGSSTNAYSSITTVVEPNDQELLTRFPDLDKVGVIGLEDPVGLHIKGPDPMGQRLSNFKVTAQVNQYDLGVLLEFESAVVKVVGERMKYLQLLGAWEGTFTVKVGVSAENEDGGSSG